MSDIDPVFGWPGQQQTQQALDPYGNALAGSAAGANGIYTNEQGQSWKWNAPQYTGGADGWNNGGWSIADQATIDAANAELRGRPSNAYDFGRYSTDVGKLPTLAADAFDNWQNNDFLNRAMHTADKGAQYRGLSALIKGTQDLGAVTGIAGNFGDKTQISDATVRQLAGFMGLDSNESIDSLRDKVYSGADNYAMVKGMTGLNPADPRASTQTLYKRQENGEWAPVLNYDWHEREKGSWWSEGGKMIMVPLGVIGAGLAAGAAGAGASGSAGAGAGAGTAAEAGITGLSTSGLYGSGTLGSGYLSGSGLIGATGAGAGSGSTLAGAGGLFGGLGGAGGITSAMAPGMWAQGTTPWYEKIVDQLRDRAVRKGVQKVVGKVLGGEQGGRGTGIGYYDKGGMPQVQSNYAATEALMNALLNKEKTPAERARGDTSGEDAGYFIRALRGLSAS